MITEDCIINSINTKIDSQELRIYQRDVQEMREQYENAKKRETEASQMLSVERARCRTQELEIERRRKQIEESNNFIKKLQTELEDARQTASGVKWELRENEIKSIRDDEIIYYKMQLSGLEAKLKKKQLDLEIARNLLKQNIKAKDKEISDLKFELEKKDDLCKKLNIESNNSLLIQENLASREKLDLLHERVGSLTATSESLQDKINGLQVEKFELDNRLRYSEEDKNTLQRQVEMLKEELTHSEGASQQTSNYLAEEIDKIKHQKAQLRCEYLQLKRNYSRLEIDNKVLIDEINALKNKDLDYDNRIAGIESEKEASLENNEILKKEISDLQNIISEQQKKIDDIQRQANENEACEEAKARQFATEIEQYNKKMDSMRHALVELDSQCDRLMVKLKSVDQDKKNISQENRLLQKELEELRKNIESQCKMQNEYAKICEENTRLTLKVKYLENELRESHTDHRNELARLAQHVTHVESDTPEAANELQNLLKQQESQTGYLERRVEQSKKELDLSNKEIEELQKRQCELINDNTILRQALSEAIKKGEQYRDFNVELKKSYDSLTNEVQLNNEKITNLEDELHEVRCEIGQKEKLIAYLQSVQQPRQLQKLKRNASSYSTLISTFGNDTTSVSDLEFESQQCEKLQQERDRLRTNLEQQKKILSEKQNEVVPLLKNTPSKAMISTDDVNPKISIKSNQQILLKKPVNTLSSITTGKENQSTFIGTMRHDIPHRWKKQFITITSAQCSVCYDGLPIFGYVHKCRECTLMVHSNCLSNIVNTCGLPTSYADYYLGSYLTTSDGSMNGWVKLWRSDDKVGNKWRSSWAVIDPKNKLFFYDSDSLAVSNSPPFYSIDLDQDQWRIFNQPNSELNDNNTIVSRENISMIIEIKLQNFSLFMLPPTVQAKQRWVRALQYATNRKIQRRASSNALAFSLFLELEKPQNLGIFCTQILDNEWLLIGSNEGLFAMNVQNHPKALFNIAGIPTVYFMELMPENDMLLLICGSTRILAAVHLQQLKYALKTEKQPFVQYTTIPNIDNCHIAVVSKPEHCQKRYVYLATADAIIILQFVEKGVFSTVKTIKTEEPCMCICSTPRGFIFGADNFHIVTFESNFSYTTLSIDNCPSDFPIASIEISMNEYLLAFHNYGVFVTSNGKRTRNQNIEWDRVPLEFVYTAPYLYIVYCDFLEIARVANFEGENSPTLTDDRSLFKCKSAHRTGNGLKPSDVMFVVSTDERVELHVFHTSEIEHANKSILKRKLADTLTKPSLKKKY